MTQALWITLVGMGLVFLAIFLLWGLMALLVRLTEEHAAPLPAPGHDAANSAQVVSAPSQPEPDLARRRRAAAAAVAVALALRGQAGQRSSNPAAGSVSPWQAAHRAARLQPPTRSPRKASR